ncbi:MAG TPA: hypothetical protein VNP98_17325 [Chthoniobacterales bacterium]|nr:hypothetical protein [Chthoniobacterales bacterium]
MKNLRTVCILAVVIFGFAFYISSATDKVAREDAIASAPAKEAMAKQEAADTERIISEKKVRIGMNAEQCLRAWGEPSKVYRTTNASGRREQWVYRKSFGAASYLYLDNGTLTTISN